MNFHRKTTAASVACPTPLSGGATAVSPQLAADGGAAANLSALPEWADNEEGRALLAAIAAERPEKRNYDNGCSQWGGWEYRGRNANQLRRLFNRALTKLGEEETALWKAGLPYAAVHNQLTALLSGERPDALIERVLEGAVMANVHITRCGKHGRFKFNGVCRQCRDEVATALAKDKLAELRGEQ